MVLYVSIHIFIPINGANSSLESILDFFTLVNTSLGQSLKEIGRRTLVFQPMLKTSTG